MSTEMAGIVALITAAATAAILKLIDWWLGRSGRVVAGRRDLREELADQQKRIDALWGRNDTLEKKLADMDMRHGVLEAENEALTLDVRGLRARIVSVTQEFATQLDQATQPLRDRLLAALQDAAALRAELKAATAEVASLTGQLRERRGMEDSSGRRMGPPKPTDDS